MFLYGVKSSSTTQGSEFRVVISSRVQTILVIEDDERIRCPLGELLREAGYEVYTAPNGARGLELARERTPDVVLLDLMLPRVDGWEVLGRLRLDPRTASIPAVIITAHLIPAEEVYSRGAQGYLQKPFTFESASEEVRRLLAALRRAAADPVVPAQGLYPRGALVCRGGLDL
ncbi:MAG: response regulator [Gemmatimonadota bacterium]